jgi:hypothetical protein
MHSMIADTGIYIHSGKYLRKNPIARAGFIFYLILIHLWTFTLLFFHAHSFGVERCDFQAGVRVSHGPHAMMMEQSRGVTAKTTVRTNADASAAIPSAGNDQDGLKGDTAVGGANEAKADPGSQREVPNE